MSCEAGEVCCMPSVLIQGKLYPRDQQFGSLPKQQPAVSSCAAALPATHWWSLGRNIPISFLRKGSEVVFQTSFEKNLSFYVSPLLANTAQRTSRVLPAPVLLALCAGRREAEKHPGKGWTCGEAELDPEPSRWHQFSSHPQTSQCKAAVDTLISDYKCQFSLACQQKQ